MKLFAAQMEHRRLKMRSSKLEKLLTAMDERVSSLYKKVGQIDQDSWESDATEISTAKDDVVRSELAAKICSSVPGFSRAMDRFQKTWHIHQAVVESLRADMEEMARVWKCAKDRRRGVLEDVQSEERCAELRVGLLVAGDSDAAPPEAATKRGRILSLTGRRQASKRAKRGPAAELEPVYKLSVLECR